MHYKLTQAIEQAIERCKDWGSGEVVMNDPEKTVVYAEWTECEQNEDQDVITVFIYQAGRKQFEYSIEETITES